MESGKHHLPAIEGGQPVRDRFLPFFRPAISESDVQRVADSLRSGWLTLGPQTQLFERQIARYLQVEHVVAVSSCTAAMLVALKAMGVGPGDEVITSSLTFASTVHSIIHTGAKPVLADIEPVTFGMSPEDVLARTNKRTRVYLPVHFGGQACRIGELLDMARARGIGVLEDAAHSFGGSHAGRKIGQFGDATAFSFYATKNLTSGEGGCLTTADAEFATEVRRTSYHGMSADSWRRYEERGSWYYEVDRVGYKFNMSDILSSLGISQLERIDDLLEQRKRVAALYVNLLRGADYVDLPAVGEGNDHTWHLFVVRLNLSTLRINRDQFIQALAAENIGCSVHFIPIYRHPFFAGYDARGEQYPVCEDYYSRCISLPLFPGMRDADVSDVVGAMNRIARYYARK